MPKLERERIPLAEYEATHDVVMGLIEKLRPEKLREAFVKAIPFRRFAQPSEIADAIWFFASARSDYVTGQILSVSGGLTFAG